MALRAIDFHVHLPTPDWLDGSMAGYVEAAEAYFRSSVTRQSLEELAAFYAGAHGRDGSGPVRERYLTDPLDNPDSSHWRTEVGWPLAPAGPHVN